MKKQQVIKGLILGIAAPLLVGLLFIAGFAVYVHLDFADGFRELQWKGQLGKVLRIGLLANLVLFTFLIRKRELTARGVLVSTLILLIISMLI